MRLDGDMIVWTAVRPSFRLSERGGVAVADITEVLRTFAGRPRPANVAEDRCLSLITVQTRCHISRHRRDGVIGRCFFCTSLYR